MTLFENMKKRRLFQITGGYIAGGWALIQFLEFLEGRMTISPHLVNLVGLALLLLLPTVVTLAWVHGRPGKDHWGRAPKVVVPTNLVGMVVLLAIMFGGVDLGAMTQTIAVEDENGAVSERVVPKNEFRRRVVLFYPENTGPGEDDWARETVMFLEAMDLSQDPFMDPVFPGDMPTALQEVGNGDGHDLNPSQQRKIVQDSHIPYFTAGTIERSGEQWILYTELHESNSGRMVTSRTLTAPDIFTLADIASRQLREDLEIPASQLSECRDLPVAELTSSDLEAVKSFVRGTVMISQENDWHGAIPLIEEALTLDPQFTMAQFVSFGAYLTLGEPEKSSAAIAAAMDNLYRLPERTQFLIKASYYYNEKQDADKAIAILEMWSQIYPNDIDAYLQLAQHYFFRQDLPMSIAAYEAVLNIDPSQVQHLGELATLHNQLGQSEKAEEYLQRYVEIHPTRADGYQDLSRHYSTTGQLEKARTALERAQLLDPANLGLTLDLIDLEIKTGRFAESKQALGSELAASENARDRSRIIGRQVNLALLMGQTDLLIEKLEAYYQGRKEFQNPMQLDLMYGMTIPIISSAGRPEVVLDLLDQLAASIVEPYDKMLGIGRAWALADLGRAHEARVALTEAREVVGSFKFEALRPAMAEVGGMTAEADGDLDSAVEQYRVALATTLQPNPRLQKRLAHALRLKGELGEAREVLNSGLLLDPAHPEANLEMAFVLKEMGDLERARTHLESAQSAWTDAHPDFLPARKAVKLAETL